MQIGELPVELVLEGSSTINQDENLAQVDVVQSVSNVTLLMSGSDNEVSSTPSESFPRTVEQDEVSWGFSAVS